MELQLFLAINAMTVSAIAIAGTLLYRQFNHIAWLAVNAAVLIVGAIALAFFERQAGTLVCIVFVPLVLAPVVFSTLANRNANFGREEASARYARWAAMCLPTYVNRFNAKLAAAMVECNNGNEVPMIELMAAIPPEHRPIVQVRLAQTRGDWHEILALTQLETSATAVLKPLEIRALGELGLTSEMLQAYQATGQRLLGMTLQTTKMIVLAFSGRPLGVARLFARQLASLDTEAKTYWLAIANLNSAANQESALHSLKTLAQSAKRPVTRIRAAKHLQDLEKSRQQTLSPGEIGILDAIEHQVANEAQVLSPQAKYQPATAILIMINLAAFAAEMSLGGSENPDALMQLGALWPPLVIMRNEWWRLLTTAFLHFGPLHLASNMFLLFVLGRTVEPILGYRRMLAIYLLGAIASSAFVLWLMWSKYTQYGFLVGASGAVFAVVGAEITIVLRNWYKTRQVTDSRPLQLLGVMLLLQVGIDLSVPKVSFAAHASGFIAGLIIAAIWLVRPSAFSTSRSNTGAC